MGPRAARTLLVVTAVALATALPTASVAALPPQGIFRPGVSLGGVRIGMSKADVRETWGRGFGRCRSCPTETWYYTYQSFEPQGAAVAFARGRVNVVYTLWQPPGWRTPAGLALGASEGAVTSTLGSLPREECDGYSALVRRGTRTDSIFYLSDGSLWGFGLTRSGLSPCL